MKKIICLALMAVGLSAHAQNNLPKLATEIVTYVTLKSVENTDVDLTELISKKKQF
jgi:hypothetical protein